jgi:hypothetical protein
MLQKRHTPPSQFGNAAEIEPRITLMGADNGLSHGSNADETLIKRRDSIFRV